MTADHPALAEPISVLADIGGHARELALAAHQRWGAEVDLVDIDGKGRFAVPTSPWVAEYRAWLVGQGVPAAKISVVSRAAALRPATLIVNLRMFGDAHKINHLEGILQKSLERGGRLLTDVRKGSGAYPFLKPYGTTSALSLREDNGHTITEVLLRANITPQPP
ncbi:MAG: hypothetical protein ACRCS3_05215, partial [Paracoccaceae bacterium]